MSNVELKETKVATHVCGIVMPISSIDGCDAGHWEEVRSIIEESIENAGFEPNLVSEAEDVGIIHSRIIKNLYENPIVVCDVSGKNPNVMFELGLRLAFDKPTIIVKDDKTNYSFDTSPIEHLEYPRDLRFTKIVEFKSKLAEKIKSSYESSISNSNYTTFLRHFGDFKVAKLGTKEAPGYEIIMDELRDIRQLMSEQRRSSISSNGISMRNMNFEPSTLTKDICMKNRSQGEVHSVIEKISQIGGVAEITTEARGVNHFHLKVKMTPDITRDNRMDLSRIVNEQRKETSRLKQKTI